MPDGIKLLGNISALKAEAANEAAAVEAQPKPKSSTTQTKTSFDTYSKAISETFATKALYPKSSGDIIIADKTQGSTQTAPPPKEKKPTVDGESIDAKHGTEIE